MISFLLALCIGAVSGAVAALCGVGGGILMVPAFALWMGMPQKNAIATSLAAIIVTAIVASIRNQQNSLVQWQVAIPAGIAAAVVAWFAADLLRQMENSTLTRIFAVVMIVVGVRMLFVK